MLVTVTCRDMFVNDKLTFDSPTEMLYNAVHDYPLCFHCSSEINFQIHPGCFPICNYCETKGKPPIHKVTTAVSQRAAAE